MSYDAWKLTAPEQDEDAPQPCPVCTGDDDCDPCSEECAATLTEPREWVGDCLRGCFADDIDAWTERQ